MNNKMAYKYFPNDLAPFQYGKVTLADFYNVARFDDVVKSQFDIMHSGWEKDDVYRYRTVRLSSNGQYSTIKSKNGVGEQSVVVFASNDYFGLAQDPLVKEEAKRVIDEFGISSTGSSPTTGLTKYHVALEMQLAKMFGKESALLFNSGFAVNIGCLPPLSKGCIVFCDRLCHSSIQDGLRMAVTYGAEVQYYRHNDMAHLEELILKHQHKSADALIITEDCFSMDGDFADLAAIVTLKNKYHTKLYLDCAHGFGVLNPIDRDGIYAYLHEVDYIMVTFSKVAGGVGGAMIADRQTVKYLNFLARTHMFSVSPPPAICAAVLRALEIYQSDKDRLVRLRNNISYFRDGLISLGVTSILPNHGSPIFPVLVGDEQRLGVMSKYLFDNGICVTPIVYPAVARNGCRFRFTVSSEHKIVDMDRALSVLAQAFLLSQNQGKSCLPG